MYPAISIFLFALIIITVPALVTLYVIGKVLEQAILYYDELTHDPDLFK